MFKKIARWTRLNELKRMREHRDKILKSNNEGRIRYLLTQWPGVGQVSTSSGLVRNSVTIYMFDGHEYPFTGYSSVEHGMKNAADYLYQLWLDEVIYKRSNLVRNKNQHVAY